MDGYNVDSYGNANGNGDGYGNGDRTRDFMSQPYPYSPRWLRHLLRRGISLSGLEQRQCPQMGMAALDLNSHGEGWPGMVGYEGLLRSGPQDGGMCGSMALPVVEPLI